MKERLGCEVVIRYASTESSVATSTALGDDPETVALTVGQPLEGVEMMLTDEDGELVLVNEVGQVRLRSRAQMRGYWNDPERTTETITDDGWVITGDLGWVGEDGNLRIVGRVSDMYIRGGYNVYPTEVENRLCEHAAVAAAAVVGAAAPTLGEIGVAFVVPKPGHSPDGDDLRAFCRAELADYKAPDRVVLVESLPLTSMGKVDKRALGPTAEAEALNWRR
jgi:acyl-CoA synthetase (AMP-forming)/AMP-acid ligase II